MVKPEIIAAVQAHAAKPENYVKGWDNVHEAMTGGEIAQMIERDGGADTAEKAIEIVGKAVGIWFSRDEEARAYARSMREEAEEGDYDY